MAVCSYRSVGPNTDATWKTQRDVMVVVVVGGVVVALEFASSGGDTTKSNANWNV